MAFEFIGKNSTLKDVYWIGNGSFLLKDREWIHEKYVTVDLNHYLTWYGE